MDSLVVSKQTVPARDANDAIVLVKEVRANLKGDTPCFPVGSLNNISSHHHDQTSVAAVVRLEKDRDLYQEVCDQDAMVVFPHHFH